MLQLTHLSTVSVYVPSIFKYVKQWEPEGHFGGPQLSILMALATSAFILQVNNYIVRSYRDAIVVANIATRRTNKA